MVMGKNKLMKATYVEYELSLWGAMLIAFAVGVWINKYFQNYFWIILLIGIVAHGIGMYRINKRSK